MILLQQNLMTNLKVGGKEAVLEALQCAIRLEHSTIPLYLYGLYSIDSAKNAAIARLIRSVVIDEMLHMTLACNVLNALGGSPIIDDPAFIPTYPGPLPGGVEQQLKVHLAPYSAAQLQTFLTVEEPENPLVFPVAFALAAAKPTTIGQFYAEIKRQIAALPAGSFNGSSNKQVGPDIMDGSVVVTDLDTANQAIDMIVDQGEGTSESPLEATNSKQFAHYYRFEEIAKGKTLIPNPAATSQSPDDEKYIYGGPPIPFDPTGVYRVPTDPKAANYPPGSAAHLACDTFNYTYTSLLKVLHDAFNGQPDLISSSAIGLMESMKTLAKGMMSGTDPSGVNVGPSFEYQPIEPS